MGQVTQTDDWEGFSFRGYVHESERLVLERALREAGGSVSKAARLLGFKHHHSLISLLNTRHQELLKIRSAARKRRQPLLSAPGTEGNKPASTKAKREPSKLSVLHVGDNRDFIQLIREQLSDAGMRVDSCLEGTRALSQLRSGDRYDVIIVDGDLPGMSGLELVLRARSLRHHRNAKIIMLADDDCEKEAWRAGVNAFLLKRKGVDSLRSTIERLREHEGK